MAFVSERQSLIKNGYSLTRIQNNLALIATKPVTYIFGRHAFSRRTKRLTLLSPVVRFEVSWRNRHQGHQLGVITYVTAKQLLKNECHQLMLHAGTHSSLIAPVLYYKR